MIAKYGVWVFIGIPMLCYAAQAIWVYLPQGRIGMALAMFGYVLANIGIIIDTLKGQL